MLRPHAKENSIYSRRNRGSVLPVITACLLLLVAYLAFATDVIRNLDATRKLQFAADAAALYAYSFATNRDGSYSPDQARSNILAALASLEENRRPWNNAPSGPASPNSPWETGVRFSAADFAFVNNPNPNDRNEIFLQIKARRTGSDALRFFLIPALYAVNVMNGQGIPRQAYSAEPFRVEEVIGQPASRVGAGPSRVAAAGIRGEDFVGFATFPLAISNQQYLAASSPNNALNSYIIDLVDTSVPGQPPPQPGHIRGSFVNVLQTGQGDQYYGESQSNQAFTQLIGLTKYFWAAADASSLNPAVVERGSLLHAFNPANSVFQLHKAELLRTVSQLPLNYNYIIPVLRTDPVFAQRNEVVGFARLRLIQAVNDNPERPDFAFVFDLGESVPVRNASSAQGSATVPAFVINRWLPAPVAPFIPRNYLPDSDAVATRPRGMVLAPALSPRLVEPRPLPKAVASSAR